MNFKNPTFFFIALYLVSVVVIFMGGMYDTIKLTGDQIIEGELWGAYKYECLDDTKSGSNCPQYDTSDTTDAYDRYQEFKGNSIFTNEYIVMLLNFLIGTGIIYYFYSCFLYGKNTPPLTFAQVFSTFNILIILFLYIGIIVIDYLKNIFVTQLILILFEDVYNNVYMFLILDSNIIFFMLSGYFIIWLINEIKFFNLISK